jgi:hypothetical protein
MSRFGWTSAMLTVVLALAGCASNASTSPTGTAAVTPVSAAPIPSTVPDPLQGTWRSTFTCDDIVKAVDQAGLAKYEAKVLHQLGDCTGVMHVDLAFADGALTVTGTDGGTGQPSPYQIVNDHTYVQGFLRNTYRVQGSRLVIVDTEIIQALYPYDPKIIPRENAFDVGILRSAPFERVG